VGGGVPSLIRRRRLTREAPPRNPPKKGPGEGGRLEREKRHENFGKRRSRDKRESRVLVCQGERLARSRRRLLGLTADVPRGCVPDIHIRLNGSTESSAEIGKVASARDVRGGWGWGNHTQRARPNLGGRTLEEKTLRTRQMWVGRSP